MVDMDTSIEDAERERQKRHFEIQEAYRQRREEEKRKREAEERAERARIEATWDLPRWNAWVYVRGRTEPFKCEGMFEDKKNALELIKRGYNFDFQGEFIKAGDVVRLNVQPAKTIREQRRYNSRGY